MLPLAAGKYPDKTAFTKPGEGSVTFGALQSQALIMADFLKDQRISQADRVAFCLPKSLHSVAVLFGILQSEAAYVPLDVEAPSARNQYILENCQARGLVTDAPTAAAFEAAFGARASVLEISGFPLYWVKLDHSDSTALEVPEDLAYILYTSGSTGVPKGVLITHRNAMSFVEWAGAQFQISSDDVFSSIAPFHFDLSVFDLYTSVRHGASVVLMDAASVKNPMLLAGWMEEYKISVWYATPTTLKLMLRFGRLERYQHEMLRLVLFAGEVFHIDALRAVMERWHKAVFYNLYGPTETNVCTFHAIPAKIPADCSEPFPIGKVCPYAEAALQTDDGMHAPSAGLEGELLIAGASVMAGYLALAERNAQSFVLDELGKHWYRTGDLVRVNQFGEIEYVSRIDRMVKRHGYRIELGEIEAAMHRHPQISECGVISSPLEGGDVSITAFFTAHAADAAPGVVELKTYLSTALPPYMVPDKLIQLNEIPQTSSNKVNYQVLTTIE